MRSSKLSLGVRGPGARAATALCLVALACAEGPLEPEVPLDGRPGPHNTGPTDASALVAMTNAEVEAEMEAGRTLFENVYITGTVYIRADDVTFRNFVLDANGGHYAFRNCYSSDPCHTGLVAEDGEVFNFRSAAFVASNYRATRLDVHESQGDAFKVLGDNVVIEDSWFHHLGKSEDAHADGVQSQSDGATNIVIRGNHCDIPVPPPSGYKSNACWLGGVGDVLIEGNWLNGGNYTIYCNDGVDLIDNRFGREYRYGTITGSCRTNTGNVWDDTGEPLG